MSRLVNLIPFFLPFRLAVRNILRRRGRMLLTLFGIMLGVAVVLAIQMTNEMTLESIRHVFDRATGKARLVIVPRNPTRRALDEEILDRVNGTVGVQIAAPVVKTNTLLASEASSWVIKFSIGGVAAGTFLQAYGINPDLDAQVRVYVLSAGRMPKMGEYEAVIPLKYAQEKALDLGDDLEIISSENTTRLKIVGLLENDGTALTNDGAVVFLPIEILQDTFDRGVEIDEIMVSVDEAIEMDPEALEELKSRLDQRVAPVGEVLYPGARGQLVGQMLATYQIGLTFFSAIAIFVGAFLIYNTFTMTVVERTREIGMLRSIGMRRWLVIRMVLTEALLLAVAGTVIGIVAGIFLARSLIRLMGEVLNAGETVRLTSQGVIYCLLVGIGVTLLAALIPAIQAARISPLEAMRVRSRSVERLPEWFWVAGIVMILSGLAVIYLIPWRQSVIFPVGMVAVFGIFMGATLTVPVAVNGMENAWRPITIFLHGKEGALGAANVRRAVGRTTLTVASLMVALTMVIGIGSVSFAFKEDISAWIDNALGGDLYVRSGVPMREAFAQQLKVIPGVEVVTATRYIDILLAPEMIPAGVDKEAQFLFNAIQPESYRQVADVEFAAGQGDPERNWARLEKGEAVFIANTVAERYNLKQGDLLHLLTRRGEHPFEIAAVILDFSGQGLLVTGTYADLGRWFGEGDVDRFTIKVDQGYDVEAVGEEIERLYKDRRQISVQTMVSFKESIFVVMDQAFRMFDVLNLIGVIIGGLGMINTMTMNVVERQREIGGLRSLGLTRRKTIRMVLAEALAMGMTGGAYGILIGYMMAQVMIRGMNLFMNYQLEYQFTARPFIIGIAIALVITQAAALPPARRAARVNIIEAIKHE